MLSASEMSARLATASSREQARGMKRHISPLRGIRGVPGPAITAVINEAWEGGVDLDNDDHVDSLIDLFSTAFEDGLVAIGLVAAALPDAPDVGLSLARRWLALTDDVQTADALGWLVWGPALLSGEGDGAKELARAASGDEFNRRAAVLAMMAALPVPIEGPAASGLRARLDSRRLSFVESPVDAFLIDSLPSFLRDQNPQVRKAVSRVVREWASRSPDLAERWVQTPGGLHRVIKDELVRGLTKGRRPRKPNDN